MLEYGYIVVGSGFSGCVIAERIATVLGEKVLLVDKREHPGGNSRSETDPATGIEYHIYGSHIFHTSRKEVWDYIRKFSSFTPYRHKVLARTKELESFLPVNLQTLEDLLGRELTPLQAEELLGILPGKNTGKLSSSHLLSTPTGRKIFELFFRPYTQKQWGRDPSELPDTILARLPLRTTRDTAYFDDPWQGMPEEGYGKLFQNLLQDKKILFMPRTPFSAIRQEIPPETKVIYTGSIDEYFDYSLGRLEYRSCRFEKEVLPVRDFQGTSVVNYPGNEYPFTRIHEYKHFHPEREELFRQDKTVICREYPQSHTPSREPLYPVNWGHSQQLYQSYQAMAADRKNLFFCGRLGSYAYCNMDEAIFRALELFDKKIRINHHE